MAHFLCHLGAHILAPFCSISILPKTDGSRVYTVEGNSGDACKIKSYDLNYQSIKGYGLMNW